MIIEKQIENFVYSTDQHRLNIDFIHKYLSVESYWAKNIPYATVQKSIEGSLCFGIYYKNQQVGFARIITDYATFGYLADVFVDKEFREKGLSKELMIFIKEHPMIKKLRRFMLATLDAHNLYSQFGFTPLSEPNRFMEIKPFEKY